MCKPSPKPYVIVWINFFPISPALSFFPITLHKSFDLWASLVALSVNPVDQYQVDFAVQRRGPLGGGCITGLLQDQ